MRYNVWLEMLIALLYFSKDMANVAHVGVPTMISLTGQHNLSLAVSTHRPLTLV